MPSRQSRHSSPQDGGEVDVNGMRWDARQVPTTALCDGPRDLSCGQDRQVSNSPMYATSQPDHGDSRAAPLRPKHIQNGFLRRSDGLSSQNYDI